MTPARPSPVRPLPSALLLTTLMCPAGAQAASPPAPSPAEAYQAGCGSCHASDRRVLRAIPVGDEATRRAWIERFIRSHPNERDDLVEPIIRHLLERTRS